MRTHYLEVESYKQSKMFLGIRVIDQRTKNRREIFAEKPSRIKLEFYEIDRTTKEWILQHARDFAKATEKLIELKVKELLNEQAR